MSGPIKATTNIVQAGVDARSRGEPATACPYPEESGEWELWLEGWLKPDQAEPDELGFA